MHEYAEWEFNAQQLARNARSGALGQGVEGREYLMHRTFEVLREASRIRRDDKLMAELRIWLRQQRDELGAFLDELGV